MIPCEENDKESAMKLAIGRLLRTMSGDMQGDVEAYENARWVILELAGSVPQPYEVCYAHDRLKGAQGD